MSWRDRIARAVAAGGIPAFHGSTERNLTTLSPARGIETRGATFHASNPDVAETFTFPREYGEPMYFDEAGREIKRGRVYRTVLTPQNLLEVPPSFGQQFIDDTAAQGNFIRDAISKGHDAVVARNVLEGIGERYPGDVYATFNPNIAKIFGKYGVAAGAPGLAGLATWPDPAQASPPPAALAPLAQQPFQAQPFDDRWRANMGALAAQDQYQ